MSVMLPWKMKSQPHELTMKPNISKTWRFSLVNLMASKPLGCVAPGRLWHSLLIQNMETERWCAKGCWMVAWGSVKRGYNRSWCKAAEMTFNLTNTQIDCFCPSREWLLKENAMDFTFQYNDQHCYVRTWTGWKRRILLRLDFLTWTHQWNMEDVTAVNVHETIITTKFKVSVARNQLESVSIGLTYLMSLSEERVLDVSIGFVEVLLTVLFLVQWLLLSHRYNMLSYWCFIVGCSVVAYCSIHSVRSLHIVALHLLCICM